MSELHEDLDRALRTVTITEAPVEQAKRQGRRLRLRRRVAVAAGVLAVAAIAAGYPALTRTTAAPPPATGRAHDPVVTAGPGGHTVTGPDGLVSTDGVIAAGTTGNQRWQAVVTWPGRGEAPAGDVCVTVTLSPGGSLGQSCEAAKDRTPGQAVTAGGGMISVVGQVPGNVAYLIVTFTDGQQLKLIPVIADGARYYAWVAPSSMTVSTLVEHLGGPYTDSGQTEVAYAVELPERTFFLTPWRQPGQLAGLPRASAVIGSGTAGGKAWSVTAYAGPWGTCVETRAGRTSGGTCWPERFGTTRVMPAGWGGPSGMILGSAAPGVASLRVRLSNGATVTARPVTVGNERMFASWAGGGASPASWTAYNAAGGQVAAGSVTAGP